MPYSAENTVHVLYECMNECASETFPPGGENECEEEGLWVVVLSHASSLEDF